MLPGLFDDVLGLRLFGYISFRIVMAALTGFLLALFLGGPVIAWLKRHRVASVPTRRTRLHSRPRPRRAASRTRPRWGAASWWAAC